MGGAVISINNVDQYNTAVSRNVVTQELKTMDSNVHVCRCQNLGYGL